MTDSAAPPCLPASVADTLLHAFLDQGDVLHWIKSERGVYVYVNRPWVREFALEHQDDLIGKTDFDLFPEAIARQLRANDYDVLGGHEPVQMIEYTHRVNVDDKEPVGHMRAWQVTKFPFHGADGVRYVGGIALDISERIRREEQLRTLTVTDPVTGLLSQRGFERMAEPMLSGVRRRGSAATLLRADFDGLPRIARDLGERAANSLSALAALTLHNAFRETDIVGRIGEGTFAVLAIDTECDADLIGQRLAQAIAQIDPDSVVRAQLTFRVGLVRCEADDPRSLADLLAAAEQKLAKP